MNSVIIADDHPFIRAIVRHTLQGMGLAVVTEAGDGAEVMRAMRESVPDLLILDIDMPLMSGFGVLERLPGLGLDAPKVLVLSAHQPEHAAARSLRAGACGYLCKREGLAQLGQAIEAIRAGFIFFPQSVNRVSSTGHEYAKQAEVLASLPPREMQVLHYLGMGMSNQLIAEQLRIHAKTVSGHKKKLMERFQVATVIDLAEIVARHGLQ